MLSLRRRLMLVVLTVAAVMAACGRPEHAGLAPDVRHELEQGQAALSRWVAESRAGRVPHDEAVIALGYAERLRLGLGSPFRLIETVLRDPRLSDPVRRQVAWGLLSLTLSGEAYMIDPVALDRAGVASLASWPGLGRHHLNLIEGTVRESRDPRAGELAIRLAYGMATMEGSLPEHAPMYATRVASLVRDRELARADVGRLLRSAEVAQGDPLNAIVRWRAERWLQVEVPVLAPLSDRSEREALELAPKLAQTLRSLRPRLGAATLEAAALEAAARDTETLDTAALDTAALDAAALDAAALDAAALDAAIASANRPTVPDLNPSFLTAAVGRRLEEIADSTAMPPLAPIVIAARSHRADLLKQPWLTDEERDIREAFVAAGTEERFAALHAQLTRRSADDAAPSLVAVWAAVALRPLAQERVWFPGFGGPSARELEERFGLTSLRFADDVPAAWRPYYRAQFETAVQDMQRVLPALDLRGLRIRFASAPRGDATLAMHDPRTRELILPPASSAGTVAHEIAHDLDWQVALRRYRVRGDYASDRAARSNTDRLAARVRELNRGAALDASGEDRAGAHARRPAENFARAVDWFVTASLADQGLTNGYLSSVQDQALTGYGTVRPPDVTGRVGDALIDILDEVAPLYPDTRERFLRNYGSARAHTAFDLVRSIADLALPALTPAAMLAGAENDQVADAFATIEAARDRGSAAIDEWVCRAPGGARNAALEAARRRLVIEAAAARARGVALQHSRLLAGEEGVRWVARALYGGPWPAQELDEGMEELLAGLVAAVRQVERAEVRPASQTFELLRLPAHCTREIRFQ